MECYRAVDVGYRKLPAQVTCHEDDGFDLKFLEINSRIDSQLFASQKHDCLVPIRVFIVITSQNLPTFTAADDFVVSRHTEP